MTKRTSIERYVPTPEDIVRVCAEIREEWSEERWRRERNIVGWEVPVIETKKLHDTGRR